MEPLDGTALVGVFRFFGHEFGPTNETKRHSEKDFLHSLPYVFTLAEFHRATKRGKASSSTTKTQNYLTMCNERIDGSASTRS